MGFFDSFQASFKEKTEQIQFQKSNNYKTVKEREEQREQERYNALDRQSDSVLLNKINDLFTPDGDKVVIAGILQARGYVKDGKGRYDRF